MPATTTPATQRALHKAQASARPAAWPAGAHAFLQGRAAQLRAGAPTRVPRRLRSVVPCKHADPHGAACAVRQSGGAAHHLQTRAEEGARRQGGPSGA